MGYIQLTGVGTVKVRSNKYIIDFLVVLFYLLVSQNGSGEGRKREGERGKTNLFVFVERSM